MRPIDYASDVREDLRAAHRLVLEYVAAPGTWLTGAQRSAVAQEARLATDCGLCRQRKASLSPEQPTGAHDTTGELPAAMVEVIHRVRVDSGRLSRRLLESANAAGMSVGEYVEVIGLVALMAGLDTQCRALGIGQFRVPAPVAGEPSRHWPAGLVEGIAWVPLLPPEAASGPEAGLYGPGMVPNIIRALSSVPDHVRVLRTWSGAHYVSLGDLRAQRAIDRMQIELVAARVSALNECFY